MNSLLLWFFSVGPRAFLGAFQRKNCRRWSIAKRAAAVGRLKAGAKGATINRERNCRTRKFRLGHPSLCDPPVCPPAVSPANLPDDVCSVRSCSRCLCWPSSREKPLVPGRAPTLPIGRRDSETDVKPLFVTAHCARCHGSQRHEASLDLTKREGVFRGSDSGPIVTPGKPGDSLLFSVLHEGRMPPTKSRPSLRRRSKTVRRLRYDRVPRIAATGGQAAAGRPGSTENDILPSLLQHCTVCHGPQERGRPRFAVAGGDAQGGKIGAGTGSRATGNQPDREKNRDGANAPVESDLQGQRQADDG